MTQTPHNFPSLAGSALLWARSSRGWQPSRLALPSPSCFVVISDGEMEIRSATGAVVHRSLTVDPLASVGMLLRSLAPEVAGPANFPAFPLAVVATSYDCGRHYGPHGHAFPHAGRGVPDLVAGIHLAGLVGAEGGDGWVARGSAGLVGMRWLGGAIAAPTAEELRAAMAAWPEGDAVRGGIEPLMSRDAYAAAVESVRALIAAGDVYQVNLTVPFRGSCQGGALPLLRRGVARGGADYAMWMHGGDREFVSFSPELLLRRRGVDVETRPIKGTVRLGSGADESERRRAAEMLASSGKDRAEHVMIVDLERNDLGRVCEAGSVRVDPLLECVEHPTLVHLESTVRGKLRDGVEPHDILAAVFPGGSVTGAPKRRALEVIGELERGSRGVFCGAMGWIDARGDMELNLPIRTATVMPGGGLEFHAGGGVTHDSTAEAEWEEVGVKAAFLRSLLK